MREGNYIFKNRAAKVEEQPKEQEHMTSHFPQGRDSVTPYLSNTKTDAKEKWFQYLPSDNPHFHSSLHKDEPRADSYLHSLERRLEKLFKQEKEMLRERHYNKNEEIGSNYDARDKRSLTSQLNVSKEGRGDYLIDNMDRKIRQLEERYKRQEIKGEKELYYKEKDVPQQRIVRNRSNSRERFDSRSNKPQQSSSNYSPNLLTQSVEQCIQKEKQLHDQVQELKKSVKQLRESNDQLLKRVQHRDQRKKHKHRTKELLQNILHKLEFINVELKNAKKKEGKDGKVGKMEKETADLMEEFSVLRLQYKHLEEERKRVEKKQEEIQSKLIRIDKKEDTQ